MIAGMWYQTSPTISSTDLMIWDLESELRVPSHLQEISKVYLFSHAIRFTVSVAPPD
jgi:hypothetical protein